MKQQNFPVKRYYLTLFIGLGLLSQSFSYLGAQVNFPLNQESSWFNENYSAYYITSGYNSPDGEEKDWEDAEWIKCVRGNKVWDCNQPLMANPSYPPYAPTQGDANNVYIYIHGEDRIKLKETFDYKNQLTLEICGELYISKMEIDVPVPNVSLENMVFGLDNSVELTGRYISLTSLEDSPEKEVGFLIAPDDPAYDIYSLAHMQAVDDFDFRIEEHNTTEDFYHAIFTSKSLTHWAFNGSLIPLDADSAYIVVAYTMNEAGYGFSEIYPLGFSKGNTENETLIDPYSENNEEEEDNLNIFNGFRLWICENGLLELGAISVKNNAEFHVDGTFIVTEAIIEAGNNYCFTGTGIIADSYEYIQHPEVNELPFPGDGLANNCPGFDGEPLPVELLSFTYKSSPEFLELEWVTATEINNDFFTLERSSDLYAWEIMGHVQGAGTTSEIQQYSFRDHSPREGISYYRLKQTDFDGQFEYFDPLSVIYMPGADGLDFRVARHPDQWTIFVPGEGAYHIELYDLTGRKIYSDMVVNNITIPAPGQTVVVRVFNDRNHSASRVVM